MGVLPNDRCLRPALFAADEQRRRLLAWSQKDDGRAADKINARAEELSDIMALFDYVHQLEHSLLAALDHQQFLYWQGYANGTREASKDLTDQLDYYIGLSTRLLSEKR